MTEEEKRLAREKFAAKIKDAIRNMHRRDFILEPTREIESAKTDSKRTELELTFSSDAPYRRRGWDGSEWDEILVHDAQAVVMDRLKTGAAVLVNHDRDKHIGVVESAEIKSGKGYAVIRLGNAPYAQEIAQDVVEGIRSKVSVGYIVHEYDIVDAEKEIPTINITRWEPLEISIVSVPADNSVGVTKVRNEGESESEMRMLGKKKMTVEVDPAVSGSGGGAGAAKTEDVVDGLPKSDWQRYLDFGRAYPDKRDTAFEAMATAQPFAAFMRGLGNKVPSGQAVSLEKRDVQAYSLMRLINSMLPGNDRQCYERDISEQIGKTLGRSPQGVFIPDQIFQRDLSSLTTGAGGFLVDTKNVGFIDQLRNRMKVAALGAQVLGGLVGNIAIPRMATAVAYYWVTQGAAVTEGPDPTFQQVLLQPKTLGAMTDVTRQLLMQSNPSVEALIRNDLMMAMALGIDYGVINGSGAGGQPQGIFGTSGVGLVSCGTPNGGAPTWDHVVDLETEVALDNADVGATAYLTNAKVRGKLKKTEKFSGTNGNPVWDDGNVPGMQPGEGLLNGYRAAVSNQVPSDFVEGASGATLSGIVFGNWNDVIIAQWGGLDLLVDPYTQGNTGTVRLRTMQSVDVGIRHAQSFAVIVDAITV